eukprot:gene115-301_t
MTSVHRTNGYAGVDRTEHKMKYLVVSGGTVSGLGKGTAISSMGVVLQSLGLRVTAIKIDPYLNIDAGTMSPFEHGEVFVLDDGGEVDLDLGNYERHLGVNLQSCHSITTGKIYQRVIERERKGEYLGKTVQVIPHITNCLQEWIEEVAYISVDGLPGPPDICLIELGVAALPQGNTALKAFENAMILSTIGRVVSIVKAQFAWSPSDAGFSFHLSPVAHARALILAEIIAPRLVEPLLGTVGDIESAMFLDGLQRMQSRNRKEDFVHIHVGMLPVLGATGEQKTRPTQLSVKMLRQASHSPDFLLCRCEEQVELPVRKKLSQFCQVPEEHVISMHDVKNTYHVPLLMWQQRLDELLSARFALDEIISKKTPEQMPNLNKLIRWKLFVDKINTLHETVTIGLVGKYTGLPDSYMSVMKALQHACIEADLDLSIEWIESQDLETTTRATDLARYESAWERLKGVDGVLVPGGFGDRGVEGKVCAANYCRKNNLPFLGICIGLQMSVIDFARSELGWEDANSTEFNEKTHNPVVINMPEISSTQMGGTMRLGSRVTIIKDQNSLASKIHEGKPVIYERHRHRYEVNPTHIKEYERRGLLFTGQDDRAQRMEIAELQDHPYFLCCQYHPEFKPPSSASTAPAPGASSAQAGWGSLLVAFFIGDSFQEPPTKRITGCDSEDRFAPGIGLGSELKILRGAVIGKLFVAAALLPLADEKPGGGAASRPMNPARTFLSFVLGAAGKLEKRLKEDGGPLTQDSEDYRKELPASLAGKVDTPPVATCDAPAPVTA